MSAVTRESNNQAFNFEAKVFKAPGACFKLHGSPKRPMFGVEMGAGLAYISLQDLKKQFSIEEDSSDAELIVIASNGLNYVPEIRPGDEIPKELLDGSASWSVSDEHKETARLRIQAQLISWLSGREEVLTDPNEIQMYIDQVENKERIREAMKEAAAKLGYERENTDPVLQKIETLVHELSYIEALRERCAMVYKVAEHLDTSLKLYAGDKRLKGDIQRMKVLMQLGKREFSAIFENTDAQTGEIISALGNLDEIIAFIRKARDDLHFLCIEWDEVFDAWTNLRKIKHRHETEKVLNLTYRLLAGRFNTGKSMLS